MPVVARARSRQTGDIVGRSVLAWRSRPGTAQKKRVRGLSDAVGEEPSDHQTRFRDGGFLTHQEVPNEQAREVGRHQSLFREVNERIDELAEAFELRDEVPILCECGTTDCNERIVLTQAEYGDLRRSPTHFAVLPGHEIPTVERVVERNERFIVVEKFGESGRAAIELDPRRRVR
jgi:hypothetical protein